ncbi:hypothetical protein DIPPA_33916 [Diplonema papillatum]|nr:hypothetical protein DIPPA_33916 [Diplonema papillatum]
MTGVDSVFGDERHGDDTLRHMDPHNTKLFLRMHGDDAFVFVADDDNDADDDDLEAPDMCVV